MQAFGLLIWSSRCLRLERRLERGSLAYLDQAYSSLNKPLGTIRTAVNMHTNEPCEILTLRSTSILTHVAAEISLRTPQMRVAGTVGMSEPLPLVVKTAHYVKRRFRLLDLFAVTTRVHVIHMNESRRAQQPDSWQLAKFTQFAKPIALRLYGHVKWSCSASYNSCSADFIGYRPCCCCRLSWCKLSIAPGRFKKHG